MNTKIYKLITMIIFTVTFLSIFTGIVQAGGTFDTASFGSGLSGVGESKSKEYWRYISGNNYREGTGTRYVFRLEGVEVDKKYYINHFKNQNFFMGSAIQGAASYVNSRYSNFYDTGVSGEFNDNTYNHVTDWVDGSNSDFGLSDNDIRLLASLIAERAGNDGDYGMQATMNSIIAGTYQGKIEIRAEIVFFIGVSKTGGDKNFLTYNEIRRIAARANKASGLMWIRNKYIDEIATKLYEKDQEYALVTDSFGTHVNCSCNYYQPWNLVTVDRPTWTFSNRYIKRTGYTKTSSLGITWSLDNQMLSPNVCSIQCSDGYFYSLGCRNTVTGDTPVRSAMYIGGSKTNDMGWAININKSVIEQIEPGLGGWLDANKAYIFEGWDYIYSGYIVPQEPAKPTITVIHKNANTNQTLAQSAVTIENGGSYTATKLPDGQYPDIKYKNNVYNGVETTDPTRTIDNVTTNQTIIFYYDSYAKGKVKVSVRDQNGNYLIVPDDVKELEIVGSTVAYNTTRPDVPGFTYVGYKVENSDKNLISYLTSNTLKSVDNTSTKATTSLTPQIPFKIITLVYKVSETGIKIQIKHIDSKTGSLMRIAPGAYEANREFDIAELITIFNITDTNKLKEYGKIASASTDSKTKAINILNFVKDYWKNSNGIEFKSLNVAPGGYYDGYKNHCARVYDSLITSENINNTERYKLDIDRIIASLGGIAITNNVIPITFYYRDTTTLRVRHIKTTGEDIIPAREVDITDIPTITENSLQALKTMDYGFLINDRVTVNNTPITPLNINTNTPISNIRKAEQYKVQFTNDGSDKELVFVYKHRNPIRIPGEPDSGRDGQFGADVDTDVKLIILDEEFSIEFANSGDTNGKSWTNTYVDGDKKQIVFEDFDVYYNETFYEKRTTISFDPSIEKMTFTLPIWVEEKFKENEKYNISISIVDEEGNVLANTDRYRQVIGKLYDYTTTNLELDTMWKNKMFPSLGSNSYRANELPIGQGTMQPSKYQYGIKLGSPFLFSINTKGARNEAITITPKILYVNSNGTGIKDVTNSLYYYKTGKVLTKFNSDTSVVLTTELNKLTRYTPEVSDEVKKAKTINDATNKFYDAVIGTLRKVSYGNYNKLNITNTLRTPYAKYLTDTTTYDALTIYKKNIVGITQSATEANILKNASHWYAEYKLPGTTMIMENGTAAVAKGGYYIVLFEITSKYEGEDYLLYGKQWKDEKGKFNDKGIEITLPNQKTSITLSNDIIAKKNEKGNVINYYYPVAIYQADLSINGDYEQTGTH